MEKKYLEILKKIKSPNVKNLIRNVFNNGGHDCYNNNAHNSGSADFSEIEEFCKMLYIDWRNFLITHKDKFTEERHIKAIERLETNPMYFPENIEKRDGTPFYKFIYSYLCKKW